MEGILTVPWCAWLHVSAFSLVQDLAIAWPQSESDQFVDLLESESNKLMQLT